MVDEPNLNVSSNHKMSQKRALEQDVTPNKRLCLEHTMAENEVMDIVRYHYSWIHSQSYVVPGEGTVKKYSMAKGSLFLDLVSLIKQSGMMDSIIHHFSFGITKNLSTEVGLSSGIFFYTNKGSVIVIRLSTFSRRRHEISLFFNVINCITNSELLPENVIKLIQKIDKKMYIDASPMQSSLDYIFNSPLNYYSSIIQLYVENNEKDKTLKTTQELLDKAQTEMYHLRKEVIDIKKNIKEKMMDVLSTLDS